MNLLNRLKVINKLRKYHLLKEINNNLLKWIFCLNDKQIRNLLDLNIYPNEFLENKIVLNYNLLNSDNFIHDIYLMNNCYNKAIIKYLSNIAINSASLQSPHHKKDMELIANAKNEKYAVYLFRVASYADSLQSPHHEKDMKLIANAKNEQYAKCLSDVDVSIDSNSLHSRCHEEDMRMIAEAKTIEKAEYLTAIATCSLESLESPYHHENMEFFANFNEDEYKEKEYILGHLCAIACAPNALQRDYYRDDFNLVKCVTSKWKAQCLFWVADDIASLENPYHEEDMELIANAKSDRIAIALKNVACNENSLKSRYHRETMSLIANAQSDDIAECIEIFARRIPAIPEKEYKEYMDIVSKIKMDNVARTLRAFVQDSSLFTNSGYDLNSFKLIVKADLEVVFKHLFDILYGFSGSLTQKERFKEALMVAYRNNFNLEDINYSEVQNELISISLKLNK